MLELSLPLPRVEVRADGYRLFPRGRTAKSSSKNREKAGEIKGGMRRERSVIPSGLIRKNEEEELSEDQGQDLKQKGTSNDNALL